MSGGLPSSAWEDFKAGINEVACLTELLPEDTGTLQQQNVVHRAAVVLLVSHFEGFLQGIAREFVDLIGTGELTSKRLPTKLRELHTLPVLEEVLNSKDAQQRHSLLKKLDRATVLWKDDAKPAARTLKPDALSRVVVNAHAHVINELFHIMGEIHPVCAGELDVPVDEETQTIRIEGFLTDLVSCRNDIAHGDQERKPTSVDVERYSRVLLALAERLNRKMRARADSVLAV